MFAASKSQCGQIFSVIHKKKLAQSIYDNFDLYNIANSEKKVVETLHGNFITIS